jgi:flagellar hook-associated protein 1 FlgK
VSGLFQLVGTAARSMGAAQLAQATVGNNAANASTPGYSRRRVDLVEAPSVRLAGGIFGTGVQAADVVRLRNAFIDSQRRADSQELNYSQAQSNILQQVESLLGPTGDDGLGNSLSGLFSAFGDLASHPEDAATRQALLGQGQGFADAVRQTRDRLVRMESDAFDTIGNRVAEVNSTAQRLADINSQTLAGAPDPSLQDEQDRLVDRLSELIGVRATTRADGTVQVVVDGTGIQLVDGALTTALSATGTPTGGTVSLSVSGAALANPRGEIGGLLRMRNSSVDGLPAAITKLDTFASGVIAAVNRVHASGSGLTLAQSVTGSVTVTNPAATLATAGLWLTPVNGTLNVGVFDAAGNFVSSGSVAVDPSTMSLNGLAAAIDALPNIDASVSGGQLVVSATNAANRIAFGPDGSDSLVALGVNGFFTGTDAASIQVSSTLQATPSLIAAAQANFTTGTISAGDNRNALTLAALGTTRFLAGGTQTPDEALGAFGADVGTWAQSANTRVATQQALLDAANAQFQQTSGVNLDEELADMVKYQHAYEASAKYISTINDMIQSLLAIL